MSNEQNVTVKVDRLKAIPREFLEIECRAALEANAKLRAQLAEREKRLAAATEFEIEGVRFSRVTAEYLGEKRWFACRIERLEDGDVDEDGHDTFDEAMAAVVAAGWLPEPKGA